MAAGLYDITNDVLGKGHFAIVKLAKHCLTGEHVAIKIVDKLKLSKEGLEQLSCEIKLWSLLSRHEHPNVVKLYQCIDTRTKLYLVMEYCGNNVCDLYDHIQKKNNGEGLNENEAKHIFRQICKAIHYCHSLKIVHRDLKPENILIINDNNNDQSQQHQTNIIVKLIDFGFSNQWCEDEMLRTSCGSLAYSAPEILLGNQYDGPKVDIWSLGCILYILLYGHNPFMQFNDNETLIKILDCSFTTPKKTSINELSINLIQSLLKKDPNSRSSIDEVLNHPWLNEHPQQYLNQESSTTKTATTTTNNHQSSINKTHPHVNDNIIDQMIDQGISISKDQIKKIIRNEHIHETNNQSNDNNQTTEHSFNDHHYIKATYQLLKDKSTREFNNNNNINNNTQELNSRQNKRGQILTIPGKRRDFIRSDQQIVPNNHYHYNRQHKTQLPSIMSNQTQSLSNLDVPQTSAYVLPLARKCSIVSEEGSICTENGNALENINSSLTCIDGEEESPSSSSSSSSSLNDKNDAQQQQPKQHAIDILVTDSSLTSAEINPSENDCDTNNCRIKTESILNRKELCLHPVSSSPDFSKATENILDDDKTTIVDTNTFKFIDESNELCNVRSAHTKHQQSSKLLDNKFECPSLSTTKGVLSTTSTSVTMATNQSPSMRVIIQSKSMNNISFVEHDNNFDGDNNHTNNKTTALDVNNFHHTNETIESSSTASKMINSKSTNNFKQINNDNDNNISPNNIHHNNRTEKNDCCRIV